MIPPTMCPGSRHGTTLNTRPVQDTVSNRSMLLLSDPQLPRTPEYFNLLKEYTTKIQNPDNIYFYSDIELDQLDISISLSLQRNLSWAISKITSCPDTVQCLVCQELFSARDAEDHLFFGGVHCDYCHWSSSWCSEYANELRKSKMLSGNCPHNFKLMHFTFESFIGGTVSEMIKIHNDLAERLRSITFLLKETRFKYWFLMLGYICLINEKYISKFLQHTFPNSSLPSSLLPYLRPIYDPIPRRTSVPFCKPYLYEYFDNFQPSAVRTDHFFVNDTYRNTPESSKAVDKVGRRGDVATKKCAIVNKNYHTTNCSLSGVPGNIKLCDVTNEGHNIFAISCDNGKVYSDRTSKVPKQRHVLLTNERTDIAAISAGNKLTRLGEKSEDTDQLQAIFPRADHVFSKTSSTLHENLIKMKTLSADLLQLGHKVGDMSIAKNNELSRVTPDSNAIACSRYSPSTNRRSNSSIIINSNSICIPSSPNDFRIKSKNGNTVPSTLNFECSDIHKDSNNALEFNKKKTRRLKRERGKMETITPLTTSIIGNCSNIGSLGTNETSTDGCDESRRTNEGSNNRYEGSRRNNEASKEESDETYLTIESSNNGSDRSHRTNEASSGMIDESLNTNALICFRPNNSAHRHNKRNIKSNKTINHESSGSRRLVIVKAVDDNYVVLANSVDECRRCCQVLHPTDLTFNLSNSLITLTCSYCKHRMYIASNNPRNLNKFIMCTEVSKTKT